VILSCIDDPDISIRTQALDLSARMVNYSNLVAVIERLMLQLKNAPNVARVPDTDRNHPFQVEPAADSDGEDPEATLRPQSGGSEPAPVLSMEYKVSVIRKILEMCRKNNYINITDFGWYIDILLQLVKLTPATMRTSPGLSICYQSRIPDTHVHIQEDVACAIGSELRNVVVRVKTVRAEAVNAANSMVTADLSDSSATGLDLGRKEALRFAVWIVGEFAASLQQAKETLDSLIHPNVRTLPTSTLNAYLQAIPKILASIISSDITWSSERRSMVSFLLGRVVSFLEPLAAHPNLEVQERAVELAELIRVAIQAIQSPENNDDGEPYLVTRAIPSLFTGTSLNPIAPAAQRNVPLPDDLNLDTTLHPHLQNLLQPVDPETQEDSAVIEFENLYRRGTCIRYVKTDRRD
jgi:AP-3 complex subunit delta